MGNVPQFRETALTKLVERRVASEEVLAWIKISAGGERGRLHLTLHCRHENDSCIKMDSDESHFLASSIAKSNDIDHNLFFRDRRVEARSFCSSA